MQRTKKGWIAAENTPVIWLVTRHSKCWLDVWLEILQFKKLVNHDLWETDSESKISIIGHHLKANLYLQFVDYKSRYIGRQARLPSSRPVREGSTSGFWGTFWLKGKPLNRFGRFQLTSRQKLNTFNGDWSVKCNPKYSWWRSLADHKRRLWETSWSRLTSTNFSEFTRSHDGIWLRDTSNFGRSVTLWGTRRSTLEELIEFEEESPSFLGLSCVELLNF